MKKTAKKILCWVLVLAMAIPFAVFSASAETSAQAEIEPLYTVNFNGDSNMAKLEKQGWDANMTVTRSSDGTSVDLKIKSGNWGNVSSQLNGLNIQGGSYTFVFTVTASDDNEEIGLLLDHQTGFVVNPGKNTYRYTNQLKGTTPIATTEYDGTGELTQTYAIEVAGVGEGTTMRGDSAQPNVTIVAYNLYNLTTDDAGNEVWNLAATLEDKLDGFFFDWGYAGDCDANIYARFSRDRKNYNDANNGTITISNFTVYEGLVANDLIQEPAAPEVPETPATPGSGITAELLYEANFNGDSTWTVGSSWAGMNTTVIDGGKGVVLKPENGANADNRASAWGKALDTSKYPMLGNAYTVMFTVTASDEDEAVGFYPDWATGFVLTPGKDSFRFNRSTNEGRNNEDIVSAQTYSGTGALTQTYAIAFKDEGTSSSKYNCTAYDLYVLQDGIWVKLYSLNDAERTLNKSTGLNWDSSDYEVVLRFYRDPKIGNQDGSVTISDLKVYRGIDIFPKLGMADGASVRMNTPTGIRFTGSVDKTYFDSLKTQYGADNVTLGMLITPTDYLTANNLVFTKEALDACEAISGAKYLEIDAITVLAEDAYYKVNCAMTNVLEANYARDFSAILYIKVNGEIVEYSAYNAENNSRSIAEVAQAAYNDVKAEADEVYKYASETETGITVYSPYENRAILKDFFA